MTESIRDRNSKGVNGCGSRILSAGAFESEGQKSKESDIFPLYFVRICVDRNVHER